MVCSRRCLDELISGCREDASEGDVGDNIFTTLKSKFYSIAGIKESPSKSESTPSPTTATTTPQIVSKAIVNDYTMELPELEAYAAQRKPQPFFDTLKRDEVFGKTPDWLSFARLAELVVGQRIDPTATTFEAVSVPAIGGKRARLIFRIYWHEGGPKLGDAANGTSKMILGDAQKRCLDAFCADVLPAILQRRGGDAPVVVLRLYQGTSPRTKARLMAGGVSDTDRMKLVGEFDRVAFGEVRKPVELTPKLTWNVQASCELHVGAVLYSVPWKGIHEYAEVCERNDARTARVPACRTTTTADYSMYFSDPSTANRVGESIRAAVDAWKRAYSGLLEMARATPTLQEVTRRIEDAHARIAENIDRTALLWLNAVSGMTNATAIVVDDPAQKTSGNPAMCWSMFGVTPGDVDALALATAEMHGVPAIVLKTGTIVVPSSSKSLEIETYATMSVTSDGKLVRSSTPKMAPRTKPEATTTRTLPTTPTPPVSTSTIPPPPEETLVIPSGTVPVPPPPPPPRPQSPIKGRSTTTTPSLSSDIAKGLEGLKTTPAETKPEPKTPKIQGALISAIEQRRKSLGGEEEPESEEWTNSLFHLW